MSKNLVAYFSARGSTKGVAEKLANVVNGDLYEIEPEEPYTAEDLDWTNPKSRSSIEMKENRSFRPSIKSKVDNIDDYDTIYLGFPIWWYVAPTIVNTFLESYDFSGKTIIPFATSGSSGMENTVNELKPSCSDDARFIEGKRFPASVSEDELKSWIDNLNI